MQQIQGSSNAFAAVLIDGSVLTWGLEMEQEEEEEDELEEEDEEDEDEGRRKMRNYCSCG